MRPLRLLSFRSRQHHFQGVCSTKLNLLLERRAGVKPKIPIALAWLPMNTDDSLEVQCNILLLHTRTRTGAFTRN